MVIDDRGRWPAGHRAAVVLTFDIDGEYGAIADHGPDNWYWRSEARYDLETGVWRVLRLLDDLGISATFCWVGHAADDRPDAVRATQAAGHEIASHGWDHRPYASLTPDEQRADIERTLDRLAAITGERPVGHKTPSRRSTPETIAVVQSLGLQWNMDIADHDVPYAMRPDPTLPQVIQFSPSRLWDDDTFFVRPAVAPAAAAALWRDDIDVLRAEGGLMCLTLHPWIIGRPGPSQTLLGFLDYVISLGDVWIARADHVALWWRERLAEATR